MFNTLALPDDLAFLNEATSFASFFFEPDDPNEQERTPRTFGTTEVIRTPVPASPQRWR